MSDRVNEAAPARLEIDGRRFATADDAIRYLVAEHTKAELVELLLAALATERATAAVDVAVRRICNVLDNDEGGAELYEAALELYRARLSGESE